MAVPLLMRMTKLLLFIALVMMMIIMIIPSGHAATLKKEKQKSIEWSDPIAAHLRHINTNSVAYLEDLLEQHWDTCKPPDDPSSSSNEMKTVSLLADSPVHRCSPLALLLTEEYQRMGTWFQLMEFLHPSQPPSKVFNYPCLATCLLTLTFIPRYFLVTRDALCQTLEEVMSSLVRVINMIAPHDAFKRKLLKDFFKSLQSISCPNVEFLALRIGLYDVVESLVAEDLPAARRLKSFLDIPENIIRCSSPIRAFKVFCSFDDMTTGNGKDYTSRLFLTAISREEYLLVGFLIKQDPSLIKSDNLFKVLRIASWSMMKYLLTLNADPNKEHLRTIIESDFVEALSYLHSVKRVEMGVGHVDLAYQFGSVKCLEYFKRHVRLQTKPSKYALVEAMSAGNLKAVRLITQSDHHAELLPDDLHAPNLAGRLDIIQNIFEHVMTTFIAENPSYSNDAIQMYVSETITVLTSNYHCITFGQVHIADWALSILTRYGLSFPELTYEHVRFTLDHENFDGLRWYHRVLHRTIPFLEDLSFEFQGSRTMRGIHYAFFREMGYTLPFLERDLEIALEQLLLDSLKYIYEHHTTLYQVDGNLLCKALAKGDAKVFRWAASVTPNAFMNLQCPGITFYHLPGCFDLYKFANEAKGWCPDQLFVNMACLQGLLDVVEWAFHTTQIMPDDTIISGLYEGGNASMMVRLLQHLQNTVGK